MKARGIEPLCGSHEDDGLKWCIDASKKCIPKAEECACHGLGILGLSRTPRQLRLVNPCSLPGSAPSWIRQLHGRPLRQTPPDRLPNHYGQAKTTLARRMYSLDSTTIASPKILADAATPATSPSNSKARKSRYCRPKSTTSSVSF